MYQVKAPKDKIMHSFGHKTVNFSQSKPANQKTSLTKLVTFDILMDELK